MENKLNIISDKDFPQKIKEIEESLNTLRHEGYFEGTDRAKLYYEYFLNDNAVASVVIVHGLSEFTKKFYELTYYFSEAGYNVFLYDQRCHGKSDRLTDRTDMIHVENFYDYSKDLKLFLENIVLPVSNNPVYIYSHSMGGAVTLMYLEDNKEYVKKALLSSPLIKPNLGGIPFHFARISLGIYKLFAGSKRWFKMSGEFNPEASFNSSNDDAHSRFKHNMEMRISDKRYQSTPYTVGWVHSSLKAGKKILSCRFVKKINTPILILSAENDTVVQNPAQKKFAEKCPSAEIYTVKNAKHSVYSGKSEVIEDYLNKILEFFSS